MSDSERSSNGDPRRLGRREAAADKRESLLAIAAQLFARQGYAETSIEQLAKAADLQRGGLYHYISSKQDLLFEIHERATRPLIEMFAEIIDKQLPPRQELNEFARALMRVMHDFNHEIIVFQSEWRTINEDQKWQTVRDSRELVSGAIESTLKRGAEGGDFVISDPRLAVLAFVGMINYAYQWYRPGGSRQPEEIADYFTQVFFQGVAG